MELTSAPTISLAEGARLPATEPEWSREVRADRDLLAELAEGLQGPFHLLFPERFGQNLAEFQQALADAGVAGQVYYGKKANKSTCWLQVCADAGAGVDVASAPELAHALGAGIRGHDIVVTGAAKSDELLWLAARHDCVLTVDAPDELARVVALGLRPRVLLRVLPEVNADSRFGFTEPELDQALEVCARDGLDMRGFSFHLNGYQPAPRAAMAARLVDRCVLARRLGLTADNVNIGGGFACSYVPEDDWSRFNEEYRDDWFHANRTFTHFYPYHQSPTGARMLQAILAELAPQLIRTETRLLMEPGRALLDGAGMTVFPIQGYKDRDGYGIVTVDGLSASISEQWKGSEFLPDPVLWPDSDAAGSPVRACVGGASCMDYDMLTWRKVHLSRRPEYGDLLIYPNTAGYQMDKNETEFHQLPLPRRVVLTRRSDRFAWRLDDGRWVHRTKGSGS